MYWLLQQKTALSKFNSLLLLLEYLRFEDTIFPYAKQEILAHMII